MQHREYVSDIYHEWLTILVTGDKVRVWSRFGGYTPPVTIEDVTDTHIFIGHDRYSRISGLQSRGILIGTDHRNFYCDSPRLVAADAIDKLSGIDSIDGLAPDVSDGLAPDVSDGLAPDVSDKGNKMTTGPDPQLFHKMNQPFDSPEEAKTALSAFIEDVIIARKKHKVTDVLLTMQVTTLCSDDRIGDISLSFMLGDSGKGEILAAMSYGEMKKTRGIRIANLLENGVPSDGDEE